MANSPHAEYQEASLSNRQVPLPKWEEIVANIPNRNSRFGIRNYIESLEPQRDCQLISYLFTCYEFPWDLTLQRFGAPFMHALLDDPLLQAVGMRPAPKWLQALVRSSIRLRGRLVRLLPPRRKPHLLTRQPNRTYQDSYTIGDLGASR